MKFKIPVLYGAIRDGRKSEAVAKFVHSELLKYGAESVLIDPREYHGGSLERKAPEPWKSVMSEADALLIVSPEYNHGYPGALKEMLDSLYDEYKHKPVGIIGAAGFLGGGRMVEQLRQVVIELHMVPIREAGYFPLVWEMVDEKGELKEPEKYAERLKPLFKELFWYAEVLKDGRDKHPFDGYQINLEQVA